MTAPLLYDAAAEAALLGAALLSGTAAADLLAMTDASDFGKPSYQAVHNAIAELYRAGAALDVGTLYDQLRRDGAAWPTTPGDLVALQAGAPAPSSAPRYATIVVEYALRRRLVAEAAALQKAANDLTLEPSETLDSHRARLAAIDSPALLRSPGDLDVVDFIEQQEDASVEIVPGLLTEDDRVVLVAPEGVGKSELERQIAVCVSHGLHPFTFEPIVPAPVLMVDLENPRGLVRRRFRFLLTLARVHGNATTSERLRLWMRPGGIDLRKRSDRLALEDVIRRNRPKLVCLGPVYKAYQRKSQESDEQVAAEVQAVLDDLRTRFHFCLVLEGHAPQSSGGYREMRPFGSSLWLRWPEFGLKLLPDHDRPRHVLEVGRWRGDRADADWPDQLHRSHSWPWVGYWHRPSRAPVEEEAF